MEDAGNARPEDVVEVGLGALDVVEGAHGKESVLLVEGGKGDESAVIECVDVVIQASQIAIAVGAGPAGEVAADIVVNHEEEYCRSQYQTSGSCVSPDDVWPRGRGLLGR